MNPMNRFRYQAIDRTGRVVEGCEVAASREQAVDQLEQQGLKVTSIVADSSAQPLDPESSPVERSADTSDPPSAASLKPSEVVQVGKDVGQLGAVGLPLEGGLAALAAELPQGRHRRGLEQLVQRLRAGDTLDDALHRLGAVPSLVSILRAGRQTDNTVELLELYMTQIGAAARMRSTIILGMLYPISVLLIIAMIMFVLLFVVVPDFAQIYDDFGVELSMMTGLVLSLSRLVVDHWRMGCVLALGGMALLAVLMRLSRTQYPIRVMVWKIPWFGTLLRWLAISRFTSLLSILVSRSVPLPHALRCAGDASNDVCLERFASRLAERAEQGLGFAEAGAGLRGFPASLLDLMKDEGDTERFSQSLAGTSSMFEARASFVVTMSYRLLEPVLYVLLGGLVGLVVIGLFLPLVALLDALS
jgi:type II secretory pathway component PulF